MTADRTASVVAASSPPPAPAPARHALYFRNSLLIEIYGFPPSRNEFAKSGQFGKFPPSLPRSLSLRLPRPSHPFFSIVNQLRRTGDGGSSDRNRRKDGRRRELVWLVIVQKHGWGICVTLCMYSKLVTKRSGRATLTASPFSFSCAPSILYAYLEIFRLLIVVG